MEFPNLGKHCSEQYCHKLDFLPMKCDACGAIFCSEHMSYQKHSCPSAFKKDIQVPVCPLCSEPVPTPRDVSPDVTVGAHIDQYCKSEKPKIYTNRCTFKNCKKKELVPFNCTVCKQNYCLKHRHTADHECSAKNNSITPGRSLTAQAAIQRQQARTTGVPNQRVSNNFASTIQGNMSEDEALARALALSMEEEEEDQRAQGSRGNAENRGRGIPVGGNKDKCSLS